MSLGASASYSASLTTIVQDEATASTAPIATFVSGITTNVLSSGAFTAGGPVPYIGTTEPETAVINVTTGSGTQLSGNANVLPAVAGIGTELIDLGGFYFKDVNSTHTASPPTPPYGADAANGFNILTDYAGVGSSVGAVVTAPAGFFNVVGTTGSAFLSATPACAAAVVNGTGTINSSGSTATFAAITPLATTTPLYVCLQAATAHTPLWVAGTPSIVATLNSSTAAAATAVTATGNLYPLNSNGGTVIVREYVPAGAAATGYQSFIRVINTGSIPSFISFAFIDDTLGGTAGAAGTTSAAVPAGGAITMTSAQIEALSGIKGPSSAGARPRVQVTAATNITVQSYLYNAAANVFTEVSGGSNGNGGSGIIPATGQ